MTQHRRGYWPLTLKLPPGHGVTMRTWQLSIRSPRASSAWFAWSPPTDVFETDEGALVRVEVAGLSEADLHVSLSDGRLVIDGLRRDPLAEQACACTQKEIASGRFRVDVAIPWRVDPEGVHAAYADGFLSVVLPRSDRS